MVLFLSLTSTISTLSLSASNFISLHPELINEIAGHALVHDLYSHMHSGSKAGLSRRLKRKTANVRRRWFVDNIVMHHKRLHDKNRELTISKIREQALSKRDALKKQSPSIQALQRQQIPQRDEAKKWRELIELKQNAEIMRGRVDTRRLRARSRWLSVADSNAAN
ncbi:MAG: hypothetical protein SFV53_02335 [Rickettsiales bacterium]|nr:hypothetical protein [Rickettsiales bacterium]